MPKRRCCAATIERHRCLLFSHKPSLYSFWTLAVRKPDLVAFEELFRHHALAMLELVPAHAPGALRVAHDLEAVPFRKRAERSMAIVAAMVGAVTLARIAPDSRISDSVLLATRDYIIRSGRRQ